MPGDDYVLFPFPVPFGTVQHKFKTVKVAGEHADEFTRKLLEIARREGLREATINIKGKVVHKRKYPFSWGAFILSFFGILILLAILMFGLTHPLSLARQSVLQTSLGFAIVLSPIIGYAWGKTRLEWNYLTISRGSNYLYLQFDITNGDAYVGYIVDEIGIPVEDASVTSAKD